MLCTQVGVDSEPELCQPSITGTLLHSLINILKTIDELEQTDDDDPLPPSPSPPQMHSWLMTDQ
jgi:hypothetical protein